MQIINNSSCFKYFFILSIFGLLTSCFSRKPVLTQGIPAIKLGEAMPAQDLSTWKGYPIHDTLFLAGDFSWRGTYVEYPQGTVLIEEDFGQEGVPPLGIVNRLRVETPDITLHDAFQVGMSVDQLKSLASNWFVLYLEDYDVVDISSERYPGLHFLVSETSILTKDHTSLKLKHINKEAKIVSIVIM